MQLADCDPLSPEDIASIVSGSVSLLEEDDFGDLNEILGQAEDLEHNTADGKDAAAAAAMQQARTQKDINRRVIREKLSEISESHRRGLMDAERKMALESDDSDVEGLQVFRSSYKNWKMHNTHNKK